MPAIHCPIADCNYVTDDVEPAVAAALLTIHNNVHVLAAGSAPSHACAPKISRPSISKGSSEEIWNAFTARWNMFKQGTNLNAEEATQQLFQCCDEDLGNDILKSHPNSVSDTEQHLIEVIKRIAVIPVAISVKRADLLSIKQHHGESARSFFARINGKAATCGYSIACPNPACNFQADFTYSIVKDVLISGLCDDDIKKEVLGFADLDTQNFIEAKEMARDALSKPFVAGALSSTYKKTNMDTSKAKTRCKTCKVEIDRFTWNKRQHRMIECSLCLTCWNAANPRKSKGFKANLNTHSKPSNEANAIFIGTVDQAFAIPALPVSEVMTIRNNITPISLDHLIFNQQEWIQAESIPHPTICLRLMTQKEDYDHVGAPFPTISPADITAITDTGAQSCLWSLKNFYRCGFKNSDLLPVKRTLLAANKAKIHEDGAIFVRLSGKDKNGETHTAPVMVYVSPDTSRFYLSKDALIQLGIISRDFPQIGAAIETSAIEHEKDRCGCHKRKLPPSRPEKLPFLFNPENNEKMKDCLLDHFSASTFNKCPHQPLPGMTGPAIKLHIDPIATPKAVTTPTPIPIHWQEVVEKQINEDIALGVLEKVPIGEPSPWCHRMALVKKPDGTPRRTVDLSPLNRHCLREPHHVKPPSEQAKSIPPNRWKSVTDAWNGYHYVPLRPEDRHLTTFITPYGRLRYKVAPQGFLASGDGYTRRYDEIIFNIQRKSKIVDGTALWDTDLESHWWRMLDFLELVGRNGIVLNKEKFQFAKKSIQFSGFVITDSDIRPLGKVLNAIRDFPTPTRLTNIRSWFGLVNQVAHYNQLTQIMSPFKPLLSSKAQSLWTPELNTAFEESKGVIVSTIQQGVKIFDVNRRTCLRPDWSKQGIGFFLSQKHCSCPSQSPGCCHNGWQITLAGSRFLKPAETPYAPIEGEALAIAWSLEQTKYFTQGCDNLLVITDHKPLTKLLGDRTLDEISSPRLFRIKQRTLMWRFDIEHMPGCSNNFSDATSRHPVNNDEEILGISNTEILEGLRINEQPRSKLELTIEANSQSSIPGL